MRGLTPLLFSLLTSLALLPSVAGAQEQPIIAVFDLEDRGLGLRPAVRANLTDYLLARLAECGFQVIPKAQIRERLAAERKGSYKDCYDQSCQIELGRELAAQKMLSSQALRIGGECRITSTLYDLRRAATEQAATAGGDCAEGSMLKAIEDIASRLCGSLAAGRREEARASERAISDFDRAMQDARSLKEKKDRLSEAWKTLKSMAGDAHFPVKTRANLVYKFLEEFTEDNPHRSEAKQLLRELLPAALVVETDPEGAEILLDGSAVGRAPLSRNVMAGTYTVSASLDGYRAEPRQVELEPGREGRVRISMTDVRPGRLEVMASPSGARVVVSREGRVVDTGRILNLEPGDYDVEVSADGFHSEKRHVMLARGSRIELSVALREVLPGRLVVKTDPPGASIILDGKPVGQSPYLAELRVGRYLVGAAMPEHFNAWREAEIESAQTCELSIVLSRIYPMNPYKKWGHVAFWSGVGLAGFGGVSAYLAGSAAKDYKDGDRTADDRSRAWVGAMYAGFGAGAACMITGIVLWALSPGDREWFERQQASVSCVDPPHRSA